MTTGNRDFDGTNRAFRTFRIRECLNELPNPEVGDLETVLQLVEESLINLDFILRDRSTTVRDITPVIPDRIGTSIANTNPDYAADDKFPLGYPIGVNVFFKMRERKISDQEVLLLGRQTRLMLESCTQIRLSMKNSRKPSMGKKLAEAEEEASKQARALLQAINESERGNPLSWRGREAFFKGGIPHSCALCRASFCQGCLGLREETKYWCNLVDSRSTALDKLHDLRKWVRKDLLPWMKAARNQLKSNSLIRWYHKITHER